MCSPLGNKFSSFPSWLTRDNLWIILLREFYQLHGESFFITSRWWSLCPDPCESRFVILHFTRDLVYDLNSRESFLGAFWSIEVCSWCFQSNGDAFNPLGMLWGSLCLLPNRGHFCHFECILEFYFPLPIFLKLTGDILKIVIIIFFTKHVV